MTAFAGGACGARYECAGPVCDPDPALAWLGNPSLDVILWCEVGVYGPTIPILHQKDRGSDICC